MKNKIMVPAPIALGMSLIMFFMAIIFIIALFSA